MRRRRFLATTAAALSTGALAATAGCLGGESGPATARLDELWFVNAADDGCDVSVTVTDTISDGGTVYETSFRLGPAPSDEGPVGNVTRDPGVDDPGAYVVAATVDGETLAVDTTEYVDDDADCVLAKFERSLGGSVHSVPLSYSQC